MVAFTGTLLAVSLAVALGNRMVSGKTESRNPWRWQTLAIGPPWAPEVKVFMGIFTMALGLVLVVAGFSGLALQLADDILGVVFLAIGGLAIRAGIRAHRHGVGDRRGAGARTH